VLAGDLYGLYQLAVRGQEFAHTPHRRIAAVVRQYSSSGEVAVVYDAPPPPAANVPGAVYFPLRYEFGPELRQYFPAPGRPDRLAPMASAGSPPPAELDPAALPARHLLVVRATNSSAADIADHVRHGAPVVDPGPLADGLVRSGRWVVTETTTYTSLVTATVTVLTRTEPAR
jgi:hypothetical protein